MSELRFLPGGGAKRLCVLISDVHCSDGSVGDQTGAVLDWQRLSAEIEAAASAVDELIIVLNGDIIDLIRSDQWIRHQVYPWQREHPQFERIILTIMAAIVRLHGQSPDGFFTYLRQTCARLQANGKMVRLIPILGNHDKELMVVASARLSYYRDCLGWQGGDPGRFGHNPLLYDTGWGQAYRDWLAQMFPAHDPQEVLPLPFYYADPELALLATHGQWRDGENSTATAGWQLRDGWQLEQWQRCGFAPFIQPCFGDSVAALLLSGFIYRTRQALAQLDAQSVEINAYAVRKLSTILGELDLYRPASSGLLRIVQEAQRQRSQGVAAQIVDCVGDSLRASMRQWLAEDFTWRSSSWGFRCLLRLLRLLCQLPGDALLAWGIRGMACMQERAPSIALQTLLSLPGFAPAARTQGIRLHVEGHTHIALEAELQFDGQPAQAIRPSPNYSYINLGAWRSQIVVKRNRQDGYRRRGIGRLLLVHSAPAQDGQPQHHYYTLDLLRWGGEFDFPTPPTHRGD